MRGGRIKPMLVEGNSSLGLCNSSIFNDNGNILVNVRAVNYTLHHSELDKFPSPWGPVNYARPDNLPRLDTKNFLGDLNDDLDISQYSVVDTTELDIDPIWEFTGLEDARIVRWDGDLFLCGGRRDILPNGDGKIELSKVIKTSNGVKEIQRNRINSPGTEYSYLEKNWMPINDTPFNFIRWPNPIEIVEVDLESNTSKTVFNADVTIDLPREIRGSSSVVSIGDNYVYITHETDFWNNRNKKRNVQYYHRFWIVDKNWNVIKVSDTFKFMEAGIEFCAGMCKSNDSLLITFGFVDNSAYVLDLPLDLFFDLMDNNSIELKYKTKVESTT